ncbi:hypothetical protein BDV29DRAFT_195325 [Aspergillus leporis]|uniref:Gfo/Idh/MocA-like oxidoreductase N-terminal domain-containing protein n=1 Tax=Aspergillus leporis TaxID=41062 RepID=A0A5N5WK16_9EURO|nr:hypothetical protein BDV29DRAFT_195325 [Aspergillus leporis]
MVRWGFISTGDNSANHAKDLPIHPSTRGVDNVTHHLVAVASSTSLQKALLEDVNVDIATLNAGKHVLLEKAFTVNAAQKHLFLMEAMWTRFFPLTQHRVVADQNLGRDIEALYGTENILVNPGLAGSALLELAIYLTWIFQILYHDSPVPATSVRLPPSISSSLIKYALTGVNGDATVVVFGPAARPLSIKVVYYADDRLVVAEERDFSIPCARCLAEGRLESDVMPLDETVVIMEVTDRVREQNGLSYPVEIEAP